jgi:hypothetical protein
MSASFTTGTFYRTVLIQPMKFIVSVVADVTLEQDVRLNYIKPNCAYCYIVNSLCADTAILQYKDFLTKFS